MPPRRPCSLIQPDVVDRVVDVVEEDLADAGAPLGVLAHQSTSQRLWARMPASRCSYSSGFGGRAKSTKLGKNGGTVFGNTTSATTPSASCSAMAALVVPVADAEVGVAQVAVRVLVLAAPRVEVLEVRRVEVLAVHRVAAARVGVGGDDRVAVTGCGGHRAFRVLRCRIGPAGVPLVSPGRRPHTKGLCRGREQRPGLVPPRRPRGDHHRCRQGDRGGHRGPRSPMPAPTSC